MSTYEISKSSLLSLKTEILRKQEELNKAKTENSFHAPRNTPLEIKNKSKGRETETKEPREVDEEEENLLKRSRDTLEAKAKLYDKLVKGAKNCSEEEYEFNRRYLVRFNKKKVDDKPPSDDEDDLDLPREEDEDLREDYEVSNNPGEEWVEYTDCLGRTRTCLRQDLDVIKSRDSELKATLGRRAQENAKAVENEGAKEEEEKRGEEVAEELQSNFDEVDVMSVMSSDLRREQLRMQWEREEEELRRKSDVHYQDVLFNEARSHGVGYYGFSKDEQERAKQQEALTKLRKETESEQKKAQDLRAIRQKQLKARVRAAKNRKRARLGLPPEEDSESDGEKPNDMEHTDVGSEKAESSCESSQKSSEPSKEEIVREKARKEHVRPWDIGKEGVFPKKHFEYSQEEWVDKKRRERQAEFAPPSSYKKGEQQHAKDTYRGSSDAYRGSSNACRGSPDAYKGSDDSYKRSEENNRGWKYRATEEGTDGPSHSEKRRRWEEDEDEDPERGDSWNTKSQGSTHTNASTTNNMNPTASDNPTGNFIGSDGALRFSTKTESKMERIRFQRRNVFETPMQPTPIVNECSQSDGEEEEEDRLLRDYQRSASGDADRGRGVEIAPPPTFEYYNSGNRPVQEKRKLNTEDSIMAGLKFLRAQVEKKEASKNHPSEMFLD